MENNPDLGWTYDAYEYIQGPNTGRTPETRPGRPTCLEAGVFSMAELRMVYAQCKSVRKTAERLKVSPTTVKKYLKGFANKPGRPIQPMAWQVRMRSEVHAWFVEHKNQQLPRTVREIAKLSGFSVNQISRYLRARKLAMESYLASLPKLNEVFIVFKDVEGRKVPTNLISDYTLDVDRISGTVTISLVLKFGGFRIVKIPFRELETALRGINPSLQPIGLVLPLKPALPRYSPYNPPKF